MQLQKQIQKCQSKDFITASLCLMSISSFVLNGFKIVTLTDGWLFKSKENINFSDPKTVRYALTNQRSPGYPLGTDFSNYANET